MSDSGVDTIIKVGVVAGAAYLAYEHIYLPWKVEQDLKRQADWLQRQNPGMPRRDALTEAARQACQLYAMGKGGLPPQMTEQACGLVGGIASGLIKSAPEVAGYVGRAATAGLMLPVNVGVSVVRETAKPFVSAGKDVVSFIKNLF